jgi:hypothetical protein
MSDQYAVRPQKGDKIELVRTQSICGEVTVSFYENREGGTHVRVTDGERTWCSRAHYSSLRATQRAEVPRWPAGASNTATAGAPRWAAQNRARTPCTTRRRAAAG